MVDPCDEERLVEDMKKQWKSPQMYCGMKCRLKLTNVPIKRHAMLLGFYTGLWPPNVRRRVFRSIFMTCNLNYTALHQQVRRYHMAAVLLKLFKGIWLRFCLTSLRTYVCLTKQKGKGRTVLAPDHGLTARPSNDSRPRAHAALRTFIATVTERDCHSMGVGISRSGHSTVTNDNDAQLVIELLPVNTKRTLFD